MFSSGGSTKLANRKFQGVGVYDKHLMEIIAVCVV